MPNCKKTGWLSQWISWKRWGVDIVLRSSLARETSVKKSSLKGFILFLKYNLNIYLEYWRYCLNSAYAQKTHWLNYFSWLKFYIHFLSNTPLWTDRIVLVGELISWTFWVSISVCYFIQRSNISVWNHLWNHIMTSSGLVEYQNFRNGFIIISKMVGISKFLIEAVLSMVWHASGVCVLSSSHW